MYFMFFFMGQVAWIKRDDDDDDNAYCECNIVVYDVSSA